MSQPELKLVWINQELVTAQENRAERRRQQKANMERIKNPVLLKLNWLKAHWREITMILFIGGLFYQGGKLHSRFESIEVAISGNDRKAGLVNDVASLKDDLGKLTAFLAGKGVLDEYYETLAAKKGFKDPVIRPVKLNQTEPPQSVSYQSQGIIPFILRVEILKITKDRILYTLDGKVGTNRFERIGIVKSFEVGKPISLTNDISAKGMPNIFLVVLEIPSDTTAILALGPTSDARS